MSINVTVKGNPVNVCRGKMVLSDFDSIKETERKKRRKLRLEQVHEQAKAISKRVLERRKRMEREELDRLEQDGNTEMQRAHDRKLMELRRRYQDIENIGYAHEKAAQQPDVESIRQAEELKNKALAEERGAAAAQRLQELKNNVDSPNTLKNKRLQKVRDLEKERSRMVAQLPKKSCFNGSDESLENVTISKTPPASSSRRRMKCIVSKKTPIKKISKQTKHHHSPHTKTPCHVSVSNEDMSRTPITTTTTSCMDKSKSNSPNKLPNIPKTVSDRIQETSRVNVCESDDNEPRKKVPTTSIPYDKSDKFIRTNVENYQDSSSSDISTSTTTSSSQNDDSSYFSDSTSKAKTVKKTPRHHTSPVANKINLYDHKTRQRKIYDTPCGLVERMNIQNKPNAADLAQDITELENRESAILANQKKNSKQRSQDAILRENIRRDYQALLKNMDQLSKEKRRIEANQISNAATMQVYAQSKKCEDLAKKQKKMDRVFESILRSSRDPSDSQVERPITITPRDYIHSDPSLIGEWKENPSTNGQGIEESFSEDDGDFRHKKMISEYLIRIEKMKRKLLQEYGADLPDDIFNASVRSLFTQPTPAMSQERVERSTSKPTIPEIQVINMSGCETVKPQKKVVCKNKTKGTQAPAKNVSIPSTECAVSTRDQQIQVHLEQDKPKEQSRSTSDRCHPIEPIVKIITPENVDSSTSFCSNSSVSTDLVIDITKTGITVLPNERKNSVKITKESSSATSSENSKHSSTSKTPVRISFERENGGGSYRVAGFLIDPDKKEITFLPKRRKFPKGTPTETAKETPKESCKETCKATPKETLKETRNENIKKAYKGTLKKVPSVKSTTKSRSLPASRINSPTKKITKSAPSSRNVSPKKAPIQTHQTRTIDKRETVVQEKRYRSQTTQVSIDSSSTESSEIHSNSITTNGKVYTKFQATASRRTITNLQDTSDTSTQYASPPAPIPGILLHDLNLTTPILELLNMSRETFKQKFRLVSPVSSPETPSPRTMMLPSNIPKPGVPHKSLKFTKLFSNQTSQDSASIPKSTRTSSTMTKEKSTSTSSTTMTKTDLCVCKNPTCKLLHKVEDSQVLKSCPQILKKYEDFQNVCTERIASLTDMIQKVRNELKGVELSVITNDDSGSSNRIVPSADPSSNIPNDNASNIVNTIEAIHAQIKKTLMDSQNIITNGGIKLPSPPMGYRKVEITPVSSINLSKSTTASDSYDDNERQEKMDAIDTTPNHSKPKILKNEQVNIQLDWFHNHQRTSKDNKNTTMDDSKRSKVTATVIPVETRAAETMVGPADQNEDMVERLSKEILEQSKSLNKLVPVDSIKDSDDSLLKSSQALVKDSGESSKNAASNEENHSVILETSNSDFVPLLAGIPRNPRTLTKNSSTNGRARPPVTLICGPYRPEIVSVSPVHELSTIVEFDTPDTVNKSQVSTRSPSNKCRKKLPAGESSRPSAPSSPTKKMDTKLSKSKAHNLSNKSAQSTEKSPTKSASKSLESTGKKKELKVEPTKSDSSDSMQTLPDVHIEQLHRSQDNTNYEFRISQISELQSLPDENVDQLAISEIGEGTKSKSVTPKQRLSPNQEQEKGQLTLSSSASFSGLSGVSEITTTPSSDLKCPSSPEEMELALKKWGLGWIVPTLKKTREASALGSSSSSDVTPVNAAARLVSPVKKQQDGTAHDLPEISDVSSISIKHANKSTERSVLDKGRTSTPNRLSNNTNSDETISTLGSFSSELNIVVQNQSADITIPNISFSNNLG